MLARHYAEIPGAVHVNDLMLASESPQHVRHYIEDAQSAIWNLEQSLAAAGMTWADVGACLDMPSGYGRVTRLLARLLDPARITACDVDAEAVRFCRAAFAVAGIVANRDPARTRLGQSYDLIFVGSLLTHLTESRAAALLDLLVSRLARGGLLVFTTQGESCLDHLEWYGERFGALESTYRETVRRVGMCFMPYVRQTDYGVTIHAQSYVTKLVRERFGQALHQIRFAERGWDRHQDVWTFRASDAPPGVDGSSN